MCDCVKGVSKELITLRIESPSKSAPDLTLIDLPDIARVAVEGQPADVCDQIRRILVEYIRKENTVILCVVSANLDAAVNESISLAKQYDPNGIRTFGVITKPDMVTDESMKEDVLALLNNNKIRLEKGFNMVKCRAQKELDEKLNLTTSLTLEKEFFDDDPFYSTAAPQQLGVPNLAQKITVELVNVIRNTLPSLTGKIKSELQESRDKLQKIPKGVPSEDQAKIVYLFQLIGDLNGSLKMCFSQGHNVCQESNLFSKWRGMFDKFKTSIDGKFEDSLTKQFSITILEEKIKKRRGQEISGFLNYELFKDLVSEHVRGYSEDAFELMAEMIEEVEKDINKIISYHLPNLPNVTSKLKITTHRLADVIPMAIRNSLHVELIKSLQERFIEFTTYPGVAKFISENPENHQNRLSLNTKVERLSMALKELSKL